MVTDPTALDRDKIKYWLINRMTTLKMSDLTLSRQACVSRVHIRRIKLGLADPTWPVLCKLARALAAEPPSVFEQQSF